MSNTDVLFSKSKSMGNKGLCEGQWEELVKKGRMYKEKDVRKIDQNHDRKEKKRTESDLTGEWMSSSRSTEQRSHCSNVSARCMIFLTIFSRSVCSSNRSFTTSSNALRNNSSSSKCIQKTQAFKLYTGLFNILNLATWGLQQATPSERSRKSRGRFWIILKILFSNISADLDLPCFSHTPCGIRRRVWRWRSIFRRMVDTFAGPVERSLMLSKLQSDWCVTVRYWGGKKELEASHQFCFVFLGHLKQHSLLSAFNAAWHK